MFLPVHNYIFQQLDTFSSFSYHEIFVMWIFGFNNNIVPPIFLYKTLQINERRNHICWPHIIIQSSTEFWKDTCGHTKVACHWPKLVFHDLMKYKYLLCFLIVEFRFLENISALIRLTTSPLLLMSTNKHQFCQNEMSFRISKWLPFVVSLFCHMSIAAQTTHRFLSSWIFKII